MKNVFSLLASAPAGGPQIEVTFQIDANGILRVSAEDKASGSKNNIVINNNKNRLSPEDIERMISESERFQKEDEQLRMRIDAKNEFESYVYSLKGNFEKIKSKLSSSDRETLEYAINERINWLDSNTAADAEEFKSQKAELEDIASPIISKIYEKSNTHKNDDGEL